MTIAPNHPTLAAVPSVDDSAVADVTTLLPAREAVLARLTEQLTVTDGTPAATLLIIGLLRRDDGWPTPAATIAQVITLLARSLRGEDWLGSSGPAEFVIVMSGSAVGAHTAAHRLVSAVGALGVPGLSAAAGIAELAPSISAGEALRRATHSLTAARRVGPGGVVQLRGAA
jgi:GGDEF domain-containing protein